MVEDIFEPGRGRVDIRTGVGRRRRWTDEDKGRIVAEAVALGSVISEVARRHELTPQHLFCHDHVRSAVRNRHLRGKWHQGVSNV